MKKTGKILIVDDNEELLIAFKMFLSQHFERIDTLKNPNLVLQKINEAEYDIILLDMNFKAGMATGNEGIYWMKRILEIDPEAAVVFITSFGDVELAVKAIKEGAMDFIQKSWDENKILSTVLSAFRLRQEQLNIKELKQKQKYLKEKSDRNFPFCRGNSPTMDKIYDAIEKIAPTDANVIITGENGTGKEIIAREIHRLSKRTEEIFVPVDLGAVPDTLFESEMFGHVKGAFTDAKTDRTGRFEVANGGTLFLDEIANLSLPCQSKLLSALQNREIYKVGGNRPVKIDVRLISATNSNLVKAIQNGRFREDLYYRLNTIAIELPPLRERKEDIPVLASFFLDEFAGKYNKKLSISKQAFNKLKNLPWNGNIRELRHIIEKAVIMADKTEISENDFAGGPKSETLSHESLNISENEKALVIKAIKESEGNLSLAAKKLGINRSTLYEKIKKYEIDTV